MKLDPDQLLKGGWRGRSWGLQSGKHEPSLDGGWGGSRNCGFTQLQSSITAKSRPANRVDEASASGL